MKIGLRARVHPGARDADRCQQARPAGPAGRAGHSGRRQVLALSERGTTHVTESPAQNPQPAGPGGGGGPRRRKPPRRVTVTAVSKIAPRLVSVLVTGDELDGFTDAAPTSHLKLFLPPAGTSELLLPEQGPDGPVWNHDESLRPVIRTYTPRRYDPATKTLEIQLVLHGVGPASEWAERVAVGDQVAVGGPGGRFVMDEAASRWWLAADESALPALGTLLDVLPETATAEV